ncbi:MAG TPA: nucleoid-structuring protein H-NS [Chryseosolibacter sp.]|nr:nucleoid-structuring protein H-NS [Chryseosolibacter sp.]
MIHIIRNSSRLVMMALITMLLIGGAGCKSKKKAMEAQAAAEKARMEQEAAAQREAEEKKRQEEEERARREAEANKATPTTERLDLYFNNIANSSNVSAANSSINEAMAMFASPETPVLIVISEEGGQKDYDKPTTIREYLNYLKDTKKSMNKISDIKTDASGKITELELKKQ